jgi:anti-anti-sigma factor
MIVTSNRLQAPPATVLHVVGEVDTYAADDLRTKLDRLPVDSDDVALVDLSAVTFMSCTALSVIASARARLGSRLVVTGRSTAVRRLLELTGLTSSFEERTAVGARPEPHGCFRRGEGGPRGGPGTGPRTWTFSRTDVDRVRGLLMAIHGCDAEQAWRMLALAAARYDVPVGELAQLLIRAHREAPSPAAAAAALTVLMRAPVEPLLHG